ncbi:hypothetical protein [Streptomyces sp. STCH 565 A]|uniref:hypothetical protein n=1 Tax=Streptomyces sp. STCH 565 A TaxID=2950532 RepID=UPI0020756DB3|nr:hypothetical protein [Streptomyces sp. STCH 565 A]MCM8548947.1 hypothetical protein [Streptomyces sp. STCH 565 A]
MRRALAALGAALTATALLTTASCSAGHPPGPAGRVVAKDRDRECRTVTTGTGKNRTSRPDCHWEYELTTRNRAGEDTEFEVSADVYDDCRRGSSYPSCTRR